MTRQLIRPNGFTAGDTRHLAVAFAGIVAGQDWDGDRQRMVLTAILRATGLLHDPDQKSRACLGDPRTHPFGRRDDPRPISR